MPLSAPQPAPDAAPRHIAVIMDGNGRWARARNRPRAFGHRAGVEALRRTVEAAADMGVKYLTVFGFSTENWRRPAAEVEALFELMRLYVARDLERLAAEGVKIRVIGERAGLSPDILGLIERAEARTRHNDRFGLTIAFNYGGQGEIARAARRIAEAALAGRLVPADVTAESFGRFLDTCDLPDPDLVIRTSGEQRISNFLLWQAAYAELVFMDVFWPDFGREHLAAALADYRQRERRFGAAEDEIAG